MPSLLSGKTLRRGGSGEFIDLQGAQPQLPATDTTETGFTLITDSLLRTSYKSSLGFIDFSTASMYSILPEGTVRIIASGTTFLSTSTASGTLVVTGGVGIGGNLHVKEDIVVNDITIGKGYEGYNNIVVRGSSTSTPNEFSEGYNSVAIGYDVLKELNTAYKDIAIGRYALSSGTAIRNSIAIGDSALRRIGSVPYIECLNTITSITQADPVVVTSVAHGLSSGTEVTFANVGGMTELNSQIFYVDVLTANTVALYEDNILGSSLDGTAFNTFTTGGILATTIVKSNNIAIGTDAAKNLINGELNFFMGDRAAVNMTTGSYNIIIGHENIENVTRGNGIISIGGDNIVDGKDNQVNIGSIFYYDGDGYTYISSDTEVGLGTESTSTQSGGLVVFGGIGASGKIYSVGSGIASENHLLYTPSVTITTSSAVPPQNPRVGDFWIDASLPAYLQFVRDGTSTFWIHIGAV